MRILAFLSSISLVIYLISGCAKPGFDVNLYSDDDYALMSEHLNISQDLMEYDLEFPAYYARGSAAIDDRMATVGRVLFYDKNLSKDKSVSCASCHDQTIAFSDSKAFSDGVEGKTTARNSIALGSVFSFREYYGVNRIPFFWDNRANTVEQQAKATFANPDEMGMEMHDVIDRVREQEYYGPLFESAFQEKVITEDMVLGAISEFVNSLGSFNSRFDQELSKFAETGVNDVDANAQRNFSGFSAEENHGKQLYMANCSSCHSVAMGAPPVRSSNNGLYQNYEDLGLGGLSSNPAEVGLFKVPTLRNISLTAPYMHDGSMASMEEVIDHYSSGVQDFVNLSADLKTSGNPKRMNFNDTEKSDLLAFLNTLTDESFLVDDRFSDPFIR